MDIARGPYVPVRRVMLIMQPGGIRSRRRLRKEDGTSGGAKRLKRAITMAVPTCRKPGFLYIYEVRDRFGRLFANTEQRA